MWVDRALMMHGERPPGPRPPNERLPCAPVSAPSSDYPGPDCIAPHSRRFPEWGERAECRASNPRLGGCESGNPRRTTNVTDTNKQFVDQCEPPFRVDGLPARRSQTGLSHAPALPSYGIYERTTPAGGEAVLPVTLPGPRLTYGNVPASFAADATYVGWRRTRGFCSI